MNTHLDYFKLIIPCGLSDKGVTSLAREVNMHQTSEELSLDLSEVARHLTHHFAQIFERRALWISDRELTSQLTLSADHSSR